MNIHRNVAAFLKPALREGLSCSRSPFLNQCTICLGRGSFTLPVILITLCIGQVNTQQNFEHVKQRGHTRRRHSSLRPPLTSVYTVLTGELRACQVQRDSPLASDSQGFSQIHLSLRS